MPCSPPPPLKTMRQSLAFALHALAASVMSWGWSSLGRNAGWMANLKGGYFLFLTNQGLFIAWLYMILSLVADVLPFVKSVRNAKRGLLMIAMPLAFVISAIYWSLLVFSPDLIIPKDGPSRRLPLPLDLALHLSPLLSLMTDFFVFQPRFSEPYTHKVAPAVVVAFSVWYASFVEYCATFTQAFPYPFLTYSSFPVRIAIYAVTAGIALGCFRILNALHP